MSEEKTSDPSPRNDAATLRSDVERLEGEVRALKDLVARIAGKRGI